MKHLNQINAALVIIGLAAVFYSLSLTFFNRQDSPVLVVSSELEGSDNFPALTTDPGSPGIPDPRSPRNRPIATGRPPARDVNPSPNRRSPLTSAPPKQNLLSSSPQAIIPPRDPGPRSTPRTRILTTPPAAVGGNRNRPDSTTSGRRGNAESEGQELRNGVQQTREQGRVPKRTGPAAASIKPGTATQDQGRRRQPAPPPPRSSMSGQRPPL